MSIFPPVVVGSKTLIVGMSGSGKTTLIKKLVYDNIKNYRYVYVISPTATVSSDYAPFEPYVTNEVSIESIGKIKTIQDKLTKQYESGDFDMPPNALLVIDDVIDGGLNLYKQVNTQFFAGLFSTSRHYYLSIMIGVQNLRSCFPPSLIDQLDIMYFLENNVKPAYLTQLMPNLSRNGRTLRANEIANELATIISKKFVTACYMPRIDKQSLKAFKITKAPPYTLKYVIE